MADFTIKLNLNYSDIQELKRTHNKETKILFKNGDILTLANGNGKRVFKNLCCTKAGENLE